MCVNCMTIDILIQISDLKKTTTSAKLAGLFLSSYLFCIPVFCIVYHVLILCQFSFLVWSCVPLDCLWNSLVEANSHYILHYNIYSSASQFLWLQNLPNQAFPDAVEVEIVKKDQWSLLPIDTGSFTRFRVPNQPLLLNNPPNPYNKKKKKRGKGEGGCFISETKTCSSITGEENITKCPVCSVMSGLCLRKWNVFWLHWLCFNNWWLELCVRHGNVYFQIFIEY